MMCDDRDLLALVRDELPAAEREALAGHVAECATCNRELAWLRAETALFAARTGPALPEHLWQGIERRAVIAREQKAEVGRRSRGWVIGASAVLAAAASIVLVVTVGRPGPETPLAQAPAAQAPVEPATGGEPGRTDEASPDQPTAGEGARAPDAALARAEAEMVEAILVLEADWAKVRGRLAQGEAARWDAVFAELRQTIDATRALPTDDVSGRTRALTAYATYVHTIQTVVLEEGL